MEYARIQADRETVRMELMLYLREHRQTLVLASPERWSGSVEMDLGAADAWAEHACTVGKPIVDLVAEVYESLLSSGRATRSSVPVAASGLMHAYDAYYPTRVKFLILEEVAELIRAGVLLPVQFRRERPGLSYEIRFEFRDGWVVLTDYGSRFVADEVISPYFAEQYLEVLRQTVEPDDVLQGYLSEGLACLRNHLGRAAAVLLRLAAEYSLDLLIQSTTNAIQDPKERKSLERRIKRAGINIEKRAEVLFRKLESGHELVQHRNAVTNRLRSAFHSVRDLGGRAAHLSASIRLVEVRDHYTLYASSVYSIISETIRYQKSSQ